MNYYLYLREFLNNFVTKMSNSYQDWTPAGWDKRHVKSTESKEKQVNIARRLGNTVVTAAKCSLRYRFVKE